MQTNNTARIQFNLACMRLAYRLRPHDLNRPRSRRRLRGVPPLFVLALYAFGGLAAFALIAALKH